MLLTVVGDVDPEAVRKIALEVLPASDDAVVTRQEAWPEEMTCPVPSQRTEMEVAMPMFQIGFKAECPEKGEEAVRAEVIGDLAAEVLFGESSGLYLQLYEEGLIDGSFGGGFETVDGMALLTLSGDSDEPEKVRLAVLEEAKRIVKDGVDQVDFLRMKRSALGRRIRDLDSFDATAFRVCAYYFSNFDYFDFPRVYRDVTVPEILEFIQRVVTEERSSTTVITPIEQERVYE
jgi:predicted Zn-dependent peptidase